MNNNTAWLLAFGILGAAWFVSNRNAQQTAALNKRSGLESAGGFVEGLLRSTSWFD
jgi:hypothetical protein